MYSHGGFILATCSDTEFVCNLCVIYIYTYECVYVRVYICKYIYLPCVHMN